MPETKPPYPAEFKQQMVELVLVGKTPAQLAREFGRLAAPLRTRRCRTFAQCSAQLPGPSGCPQLPQGPAIAGMASGADAAVAKTDICFSNCLERHCGHSGTVSARTSFSN